MCLVYSSQCDCKVDLWSALMIDISLLLKVSLAVLHANMEQLLSCTDEGEAMTILGRSVSLDHST